MIEFKLGGEEFIQLCDLMKITDLASSGAEAKHLIADGKVTIDGNVELRKRCKVRSGQLVEFNGKQVKVV